MSPCLTVVVVTYVSPVFDPASRLSQLPTDCVRHLTMSAQLSDVIQQHMVSSCSRVILCAYSVIIRVLPLSSANCIAVVFVGRCHLRLNELILIYLLVFIFTLRTKLSGTVYSYRSCLSVCFLLNEYYYNRIVICNGFVFAMDGRAVSEPNYRQHMRSVCISLHTFFIPGCSNMCYNDNQHCATVVIYIVRCQGPPDLL